MSDSARATNTGFVISDPSCRGPLRLRAVIRYSALLLTRSLDEDFDVPYFLSWCRNSTLFLLCVCRKTARRFRQAATLNNQRRMSSDYRACSSSIRPHAQDQIWLGARRPPRGSRENEKSPWLLHQRLDSSWNTVTGLFFFSHLPGTPKEPTGSSNIRAGTTNYQPDVKLLEGTIHQ